MLFKKSKIVVVLILSVSALVGCTKNDSDQASVVLDDAAYFEAAKQYLTYNDTFGPQTDLTSHVNLKKIEFISSIGFPTGERLAEVLTVRKKFVANAENNLILLKRDQPSRQDNTTMTVGMMSGNNRSRTWDAVAAMFQGNRSRSYVVNQCDRIVFNAKGEGVCLVQSGSDINMTKLSQKYGHRLISSCISGASAVWCASSAHKQFSRKQLDLTTDVLTVEDMKFLN